MAVAVQYLCMKIKLPSKACFCTEGNQAKLDKKEPTVIFDHCASENLNFHNHGGLVLNCKRFPVDALVHVNYLRF